LKPPDNSCGASWGVKGRAARVGEADFTPWRPILRSDNWKQPLPRHSRQQRRS